MNQVTSSSPSNPSHLMMKDLYILEKELFPDGHEKQNLVEEQLRLLRKLPLIIRLLVQHTARQEQLLQVGETRGYNWKEK